MTAAPWTPELEEQLRQMVAEGVSEREIGRRLGRSQGSIAKKKRSLGLRISPEASERNRLRAIAQGAAARCAKAAAHVTVAAPPPAADAPPRIHAEAAATRMIATLLVRGRIPEAALDEAVRRIAVDSGLYAIETKVIGYPCALASQTAQRRVRTLVTQLRMARRGASA